MNNDLISRAAAFDSVEIFLKQTDAPEVYTGLIPALARVINNVPSAQQERIQNNTLHLCDSCQYTYPACPSHGNDAVFGDGKGNDNICACNKYRPISAQPTLYGYNIEHLARIAILLREENLPPERVAEALTDVGRIVSMVRAECEEEFRKAVEQCMI